MITSVLPHQARALWPLVEPILKRATDRTHGRFTTDDALRRIERGGMQLWIGGAPLGAVAVTEIIAYERDKACRFVFVAGDLDVVFEGLPVVERWARETLGCAHMELLGRKGWARTLAPCGYEFDAVLMQKVL